MNIFRQLFRQPIKLISGISVVALAVSILCVCLGQAIAADKTKATLEHHFNTIALQTYKYRWEDVTITSYEGEEITYKRFLYELPEEISDFIDSLLAEHPELVKTMASQGLASAYIPELTPDNLSHYTYHHPYIGTQETIQAHHQEGAVTYSGAVFEIVLTEMEEPFVGAYNGVLEDGTEVSFTTNVTVELRGSVENVISLEEGYPDPVGKTLLLSLRLNSEEELAALDLEIGGRYLVCGTDFQDGNWMLKSEISRQLTERGNPTQPEDVDLNNVRRLTEEESARFHSAIPMVGIYESNPGDEWNLKNNIEFTQQFMDWLNAITLNISTRYLRGDVEYVEHANGGYYTMDYTRYITDENGNKVEISEEEWLERYKVPTMARLDGTVKEFLASDEGAIWQQQLEYMEINNHAFPIIGVEKLGYVADFSRENARIVDGRDFTEEELSSGAKVCILSETVAAANGLSVGDTITPQFYNHDYDDPNQEFLSDGRGVINPWAYKYTKNTEWATTEEYTIVGLYRQSNAWGDVSENLYSFTPNTIFVPYSSVTSDMDYGNQGFFQTLVLENGAVEDFRALVNEAGYEGLFAYYDQEYTTIIDTLTNYRGVAQKAMIVGIVVYAVILLLFLLLFPGSQGKTLATMTALGAKRGQKIRQVFIGSMGILLPGSLIGTISGILLWETVVSKLAESIGESVSLEMEPSLLIGIAAAQFGVTLILTLLLALPMSRNRGISKRK